MAKSNGSTADDIARQNYMAAVTEVNAVRKEHAAKTAEWKESAALIQKLDNERYQLAQKVSSAEGRESAARQAFTVCSI